MTERGIPFPWGGDEGEAAAAGEASEAAESEEDEFGRPDAEVTTRVDVSAFIEPKSRSMDCHRTQRQDMGWMLELPPDPPAPGV